MVNVCLRYWLSSMARGIFGAGSGFRVEWRTAGSLVSVFQECSASIGRAFIFAGDWALGYRSMGFGHFPDIS